MLKLASFLSQSTHKSEATPLFRLDYCNKLYSCVSVSLLSRLQLLQSTAAWLSTGTCNWDPTYLPHYLSVPILVACEFKIKVKILLFAFKALYGLGPSWLSDLSTYHRGLQMLLSVQRSRLKHGGDQAFAVALLTKCGCQTASSHLDPFVFFGF